MWIAFACLSAFFAGITAILAKCGIQETDSTVATAIRTIVVLIFAWAMVFIVGSFPQITSIDGKTWIFLILSGLATGASWLCYFKALQLGDVNKVTPIDKSSTALTLILAFILLGEPLSWAGAAAVALILVGTLLMIERKEKSGAPTEDENGGASPQSVKKDDSSQESKPPAPSTTHPSRSWAHSWILFAVLSAVFASLVAILGKVGIDGVESNLGTAIRTVVVLVMSWGMVFITGKRSAIRHIKSRELLFICLSGLATGASWLCYYKALQDGLVSVVVPIDKLSIIVTILFARIVFGERLTKKSGLGLFLIVAGTLLVTLVR